MWGDIVLLGDLNINLADPRNYQAKKLSAFAESKLLSQLINDFTRVTSTSNSLIDHIFTNATHSSLAGTLNVNITDHYSIFVILKKSRCKKSYREIIGRNYKTSDLAEFEVDIKSIDHSQLFSSGDPNTIWEELFKHIMSVVDRHFPIKNPR